MVARRGQFILSRIDARNGALGIVPPELDEAIVTPDFPVFNIVQKRMLPAYLGWVCRTASFVEECRRASEGTTNRVRLQEDKFLAREISLPPIQEQRAMVARIEELVAQIEEARKLRHQATAETEALLASFRRAMFGETPQPGWIPLSSYVENIENGKSPATEGRVATSDEWAVLKVGAVSFGVFDELANKALPISYVVPASLVVQPGDFIMSSSKHSRACRRMRLGTEYTSEADAERQNVPLRFPTTAQGHTGIFGADPQISGATSSD